MTLLMALLSLFQKRNSDESEADMRWLRRTLEREREKDNPSQAKKNNRQTQMLYLLFPGHSVSYSSEVIIQQSALVVM